MQIHHLSRMLLAIYLTLTGCATDHFHGPLSQNLLQEKWFTKIALDPTPWTKNADKWFFTGEPNQTEQAATTAPANTAMTIMAIKVPQFTHLDLNGNFQVQINGEQDHNSVFILGPNEATRQIAVRVADDTLYVNQVTENATCCANLSTVIVRIGIHDLQCLNASGAVNVEGRNIRSHHLIIHAKNMANILLSGAMNLMQVNQRGAGTLSVLGAYTPKLRIQTIGAGTVNISGRVGINYIRHMGSGAVRIIGADSKALVIEAGGAGLTTIAGYANLQKLIAQDSSQVYLYWVKSDATSIIEHHQAQVGLAGSTNNLEINLTHQTKFNGQYLLAGSVYVETRDTAHANVAAKKKIFAHAMQHSSIYFFGAPNIASRYAENNSIILPAWSDTITLPRPPAMLPTWKAPRLYSYSSNAYK